MFFRPVSAWGFSPLGPRGLVFPIEVAVYFADASANRRIAGRIFRVTDDFRAKFYLLIDFPSPFCWQFFFYVEFNSPMFHGSASALRPALWQERLTNRTYQSGTLSGTLCRQIRSFALFCSAFVPGPKTGENGKTFIFKDFSRWSVRTGRYALKLWKLGCTSDSGAIASTIIAATASVRNVTARRSTMTAMSTTAIMKNERWVATSAPDSKR